MLRKIFLSCLVMLSVLSLKDSFGQSVFRVGAFCLQQPVPAPQAIYEQNPGVWRIYSNERDKLLNLGFNYFIACAYRLEGEDALVFMGDSLDAAPAPKSFKSTLEYVPITPPKFTQTYQLWLMSRNAQRYGIQSWNDSVTVGYQGMYNRHSARIDGVHSFIIGHEGNVRQKRKIAGINFMGDNTNVESFILPNYYPQAGDSLSPYQFAKRVIRADHLTGGGYYLTNTTPYTGTLFQAQIDTFVASLRHSARGIRDTTSVTKLWMLVQTQYGSNGLRLPTKNEVLCQVNLALAHGVKGIIYYLYSSYSIPSPPSYETGLLDTNRNPTAQYDSVKSINTNYQGTGQSLVNIGANFLNLAWKEDFTIHQNTNEPISSAYKLYDVTAKIPGGATDAETETYVEAGVLQSGSTNHYMVVNRRCTSTESREITMKFQSTSANAYLITDVFTGDQKRFLPANATTITYTFTLGPGQGKLLKLEDLGNWSGTIASNTTWSGTVCANSTITVNNGVTLTIAANTKVLFLATKKLTVNGNLQALGTSSQNVTFDRNGATGAWNGITFGTTGSGNVNYAIIDHATKGVKIDITNNITLDHCTVKNFTEQGVYLNASSATVQYCTIKDAAGGPQGIYSSGNNANPTIANNIIFNTQFGIARVGSPGNAQIRDNAIYYCTNAGVQASNSKPAIYKNYIHDNIYGIRLQTGAAPDIHDNDFYANEHGIFMEQSQPDSLNWNNFAYTNGSANYNYSTGMLVNYLTAGNNFMAQKWNNFYDGESGSSIDIDNNTTSTLLATGQYWRALVTSGPINSSSPKATHNSNAGPGGSSGKETAAGRENAVAARPQRFFLSQNFPNPFNPETQIRFALPERAVVSVKIYDLNGRMLRALLVQQDYESGAGVVKWDGKNGEGEPVGSGIYFYRIEAVGLETNHSFSNTQRLVLLR